jgi:type II secretory pathway pseudopilin PulG
MPNHKLKREAGFTLIETMFACFILLACSIGILSLFTISAVKNSNRGEDATRTTEYAQDKMEQLMSLQWQDANSDTVRHLIGTGPNYTFPCLNLSTYITCTPAGTGLSVGGDANPSDTPVTQYVDYITQNPSDLSWISSDSATGANFVRQWQIALDSTGKVKIITVSVTSLKAMAAQSSKLLDGVAPTTTLISQKTAVADTH